MQYSTLPLAVVAAIAASLAIAQSTLTVNTPVTLITCQPVALTWTGGTAPYFPRVTPGGDVSGTLNSFDQQTATSLTWTVDIAAGTEVTIAVTDSNGVSGASAPVTIQSGSTSCLDGAGGGASTSSGAASSSSSSSVASSSASSSSSSVSASSSTAAPSSSSSSTSGAPSTTTSSTPPATSAPASGAESIRGFPAAVAGLVGIVAAALL